MKKSFRWITTFIILLSTIFVLSACFDTDDPEYYGTYTYGNGEEVTIDKDGFKLGDRTYKYTVSYNTFTLVGPETKFKSYENNQVLSYEKIVLFDQGKIATRNGTFDLQLSNKKDNLSFIDYYSFSSNGTYTYSSTTNLLLCESGSYTLKDGVLILNGTLVSGKANKTYYYITKDFTLHFAYIKDETKFIPTSADNNQANETKFSIEYLIVAGGSLSGTAMQLVVSGTDGTQVTAVADEGYVFMGWSDGVTSATRKETGVRTNISVIAHFEKVYQLQYIAGSGGSVSCKAVQSIVFGRNGETVTAVADEGYVFVGWSDGVTSATRYEKGVTANISVTAHFEKVHKLQYIAGSGGSISGKAVQSIVNGGNGETVTAVADDGYVFVGWSDGVTSATRNETGVKSNKYVTARFEKVYQLQYIAGSGGSISGNKVQSIVNGGNGETVTAVADDGYVFVGWSDGKDTATRQDTNIVANKSVTANFEIIDLKTP